MAKILWFVAILSRCLCEGRAIEMFHHVWPEEDDTPNEDRKFLLVRFWRKNGMDGAEAILGPKYSEFNQRKMMPTLDCQIAGWCEANPWFFTPTEQANIESWIKRGKPARRSDLS